MRRGSRFMTAAIATLLLASSSTTVCGQTAIVFNRTVDVPLILRGQRFRKKADKRGGNQNLQRAQSHSRRGGSRPVARGR